MAQESWTDLKARAASYSTSSDVLLASNNVDLIQNALESAHLALELAMKAVIRKRGGTYPDRGRDGHDLDRLIRHPWKHGQNIEGVLLVHKVTSFVNISLSQWTMDCRYKVLQSYTDMKDGITEYRGFYVWIRDNLLT